MNRHRGITFLEMMVAGSVFLMIMGIVLVAFFSGNASFVLAEGRVHVQEESRRAFATMTSELRSAGWDPLKPPGTLTVAANQVTFQLPLGYNLAAPCPANAVCWGARDPAGAIQPGWTLQYRLNGTQLIREVLDTAVVPQVRDTRVLANNVSLVSFSYTPATRILTVQLTVREVSPKFAGGQVTTGAAPLTMSVQLRNL